MDCCENLLSRYIRTTVVMDFLNRSTSDLHCPRIFNHIERSGPCRYGWISRAIFSSIIERNTLTKSDTVDPGDIPQILDKIRVLPFYYVRIRIHYRLVHIWHLSDGFGFEKNDPRNQFRIFLLHIFGEYVQQKKGCQIGRFGSIINFLYRMI